jgi:hypothetical protein
MSNELQSADDPKVDGAEVKSRCAAASSGSGIAGSGAVRLRAIPSEVLPGGTNMYVLIRMADECFEKLHSAD